VACFTGKLVFFEGWEPQETRKTYSRAQSAALSHHIDLYGPACKSKYAALREQQQVRGSCFAKKGNLRGPNNACRLRKNAHALTVLHTVPGSGVMHIRYLGITLVRPRLALNRDMAKPADPAFAPSRSRAGAAVASRRTLRNIALAQPSRQRLSTFAAAASADAAAAKVAQTQIAA